MHPEDLRNLIIFCVVSLVLYLGYEHFILGPQQAALEKVKQAQLAQQQHVIEETVVKDTAEPLERGDIIKQSERIAIDNGAVFGSINVQGGRIDDIGLYDYFETLEKKKHVTILSPKGSTHPRYLEHGWVSADESLILPQQDTKLARFGSYHLKTKPRCCFGVE